MFNFTYLAKWYYFFYAALAYKTSNTAITNTNLFLQTLISCLRYKSLYKMSKDLATVLKDLQQLPQNAEIDDSLLKLPKTNKNMATQILIQILRISAPKHKISAKDLNFCFTNIFSLPEECFLANIKIIVKHKLILSVSFDVFKKFVQAILTYKKKIKIVNKSIVTDNTLDDYIFDIFTQYFEDKKELSGDLFEFLVLNRRFAAVKNLLNDNIFVDLIDNVEDDKIFVEVLETLSKKQRNKLKIRSISNKALLRKYVLLLTTKSEEGAKRHKSNSNDTKSDSLSKSNKESNDDCVEICCDVYQRIYKEYIEDSAVKLLLCCDRSCCVACNEILNEMKIDNDSKVRAKANKYGSFMAERILDASKNVRKTMFDRIHSSNDIKEDVLSFLFQGMASEAFKEYVDALNKIKIDFNYLETNYNRNIVNYLKENLRLNKKESFCSLFSNITNIKYEEITTYNGKLLFCEYFVNKTITEQQIIALIKEKPFLGFLYLKSRSNNDNTLLSTLHDHIQMINEINDFIRVTLFLKKYIVEDKIKLKAKETDLFELLYGENTTKNDEIFVHELNKDQICIYASICIDHFDNKLVSDCAIVTFSLAFYLAKHAKNNSAVYEMIQRYLHDEKESIKKLQIIARSNSIDLICTHLKAILDSKSNTLPQYLIENVEPGCLILLFLRGQANKIYTSTLFVNGLYIISKGLQECFDSYKQRICNLLKGYVQARDTNEKAKIKAICDEYKGYTLYKEKFEYKIADNKVTKDCVPLVDYIFYFLLDYINEELVSQSLPIQEEASPILSGMDIRKLPEQIWKVMILSQSFTKL